MPKKTADAAATAAQSTKKFDSYQDLKIWQAGMDLCKEVYQLTENLVDENPFSLIQQMRTTVIRYPSEVARFHGFKFRNHKEYISLLRDARRNLATLEVQTMLAKDLGILNGEAEELRKSIHGLTKMTNSFIKAMTKPKAEKEVTAEMTELETDATEAAVI